MADIPGFTTRPELAGTFGMVASTHWLASAAGMAVLEHGGNAFDAAAFPPGVAVLPPDVAAPAPGAVPAWCVLAEAQPASRPAAAAAVTASDTACRPRDRPEFRPVLSSVAGGVVNISVSPHCRRIVALSNHQVCPRPAPADTQEVG